MVKFNHPYLCLRVFRPISEFTINSKICEKTLLNDILIFSKKQSFKKDIKNKAKSNFDRFIYGQK